MINQRKMGAILSYINTFLSIILGFVNINIITNLVSQGDVGVYGVLGSIIGLMGILDLGFSGTMVRYYSRSLALEDEKGQENTLATGAIIYAGISVLVIIAGFALFPAIDFFYEGTFTASELTLARKMFVIMVFNFVASISTNIYNSALTAKERFVFLNILDFIKAVMNPILVWTLLYRTHNIMVVVIISTILNVAGIIAKIVYSHATLKIKMKLHHFDKNLFKAISVFAFYIFLNVIMDKVYWQTDNLILGSVVGTVAVAVYAQAATLTRYYLNFSSQIASVFLPKITSISAKTDDMTELNSIFLRIGRVQYIIIMLILTGFTIFGKEFIIRLTNENYVEAYYFALILMVPLVVPLIQNTGISILQAKNKHKFRSIVYFFIAVLNFSASIPLAKIYGGYGCAAATAGSLIIGQWIIINIYYKKVIGLEIGDFFKNIAKMSPSILLLGAIGYFVNQYVITNNIFVLVLKIIIYTIIYFLIVGKLSFNDYERESFLGIFKKAIEIAFRRKAND